MSMKSYFSLVRTLDVLMYCINKETLKSLFIHILIFGQAI